MQYQKHIRPSSLLLKVDNYNMICGRPTAFLETVS